MTDSNASPDRNYPFAFMSYVNPARLGFDDVRNPERAKPEGIDQWVASQAWEALLTDVKRGVIDKNTTDRAGPGYPSVTDPYLNYLYLRHHHHWIWSFYVLAVRIHSLKATPVEFIAFFSAGTAKRLQYEYVRHKLTPSLSRRPPVAIVIATLNRYPYLRALLDDLAAQTYQDFTIYVVDQSPNHEPDIYDRDDLTIVMTQQPEPGLWRARNTAISQSREPLIALLDDDVRLKPDWLENHLKCLETFSCDVSAGVFYPEGTSIPDAQNVFRVSQQFPTNNALVTREVFAAVGLFDRQFEGQRKGDFEFGVRASRAGFLLVSNPASAVVDRKAPSGGLREMGSWDSSRNRGLLTAAPLASVTYLMLRHFGPRAARHTIIHSVISSFTPYRFKRTRWALVVGGVLSLVLFPISLTRGIRSWRQGRRKLSQGPRIDPLDSPSRS